MSWLATLDSTVLLAIRNLASPSYLGGIHSTNYTTGHGQDESGGSNATTVPLFNPHGDEGEMKAADNEDSRSLALPLLSASNDGELGAYKPWCL